MEFCRICALRKRGLRNMFDKKTRIVERIFFCTGLRFVKQEGFPTQICFACLKSLTIAHKFREACLNSDDIFLKMADVQKEEIESNDNKRTSDVKDEMKTERGLTETNEDCDFESLYIIELADEKDEVKEETVVQDKEDQKISKGIPDQSLIRSSATNENSKTNKRAYPKKELKEAKRRIFNCRTCKLEFTERRHWAKHKRDKHKKNLRYVCEVCGKVFKNHTVYYIHVKSHGEPNYKCEHCSYSTTNRSDLIKHLRIHSDVRMYSCNHCKKSFNFSSNLVTHIRKHHSDEPFRFECPKCGKRYFSKKSLDDHIDSHDQIKRHKCEACSREFRKIHSWKKHVQNVHQITVPTIKPGRKKTNLMTDFINNIAST